LALLKSQALGRCCKIQQRPFGWTPDCFEHHGPTPLEAKAKSHDRQNNASANSEGKLDSGENGFSGAAL
jgi:hypothetical protein